MVHADCRQGFAMQGAIVRFLALVTALLLALPASAQPPRTSSPWALTKGASMAAASDYTPKGPIEAKYIATGPWSTSMTRSAKPCDRKGNRCTLFQPSDLGSNPLLGRKKGFAHPVIAWANGTGVPTAEYALILRHWASWGFVVVASDDTSTALGESTEDAANYVIAQSRQRTSPFYRKIDPTQIGVSGHSQGGLTAINLFVRQPKLFKTAIPFNGSLIGVGPVFGTANTSDLRTVTSGSIFFMGSTVDPLANTAFQLADYQATSDSVGKAIGSLTYAGHDGLVHTSNCTEAECVAALGYPTAWMMWRLQGATDGGRAFVPQTGEFSRSNDRWALQVSNGT